MLKTLVAAFAVLAAAASAQAASAVNLDQEPRTLIVTEGGNKSELALAAARPSISARAAASSPCPMATSKP
jgi:hypothetical protein